MRTSWRTAGILFAGTLLVGGLVASCANQPVAGTGTPGATPAGPGGTIIEVPTSTSPIDPTATGTTRTNTTMADLPLSSCPPTAMTPGGGAALATPTDEPMITVTQGTNSWVASDLTQPFAIAVYPDGTAIRTEAQGILSEPLPAMTIGRLDACHLQEAVAEIRQLATTDLGQATVTDQGTTTISLHEGDDDVVIDVYALGVGDELVQKGQQAARQRVTALIDNLTTGLTQTATWTPDRLRVSAYGTPADLTGGMTWPLPGTIATALNQGGRRPCGVFAGDDASAISAELGGGPAASRWTDGTQTLVLAVGVLVPGQDCSPT